MKFTIAATLIAAFAAGNPVLGTSLADTKAQSLERRQDVGALFQRARKCVDKMGFDQEKLRECMLGKSTHRRQSGPSDEEITDAINDCIENQDDWDAVTECLVNNIGESR